MSDIAIRVENLGKQYRIGSAQQARYKTLRDSLTDIVAAPFRRVASLVRGEAYGAAEMDETIWALKDVSFEVQRGEVVGIIGRNGAGKSTLLKILSRITEPTRGRAEIHGRVGSLLEVGTGFHPELTGRENIYLNGAILGMTREEIERKFDEIVAFAELEKFLDTPVKFYSSGMYVRLAFAVAAHLEPEILLVDEVLAVGDVSFQKKCLGRMGDIAQAGRTVLFVSHNMGAIQSLTSRCLLFEDGRLVSDDMPTRIVETYLNSFITMNSSTSRHFDVKVPGLSLESVELDREVMEYGFNKPLKFDLHFKTDKDFTGLRVVLQVINSVGARITNAKSKISRLRPGCGIVSIILENHHLPPGHYSLNMVIHRFDRSILLEDSVLTFSIPDIGFEDSFLVSRGDRIGACIPAVHFVQYENEIPRT